MVTYLLFEEEILQMQFSSCQFLDDMVTTSFLYWEI